VAAISKKITKGVLRKDLKRLVFGHLDAMTLGAMWPFLTLKRLLGPRK